MTDLVQLVQNAWHWLSAILAAGTAVGLVATLLTIASMELRKAIR